jgi:peptidoglycan/xylan/chitin deacetylase (PgdA/CDA1 family)
LKARSIAAIGERDAPASAHARGNLLVRALCGLAPGPTLSVLIYHRVLARFDPLRPGEPTSGQFESRMRWLKANFDVVPLADGVAGLRNRSLPRRALAVTFDDGYRDNHDIALPILVRLGVPATFFVATDYLDGGRMFNDTVIEAIRAIDAPVLDLEADGLGVHSLAGDDAREAAVRRVLAQVKYLPQVRREAVADRIAALARTPLANDLMMSSRQVHALRTSGMEVGAHTCTHPILAAISASQARDEIVNGRKRLESITEGPISLFAYPNGRPNVDFTAAHVVMAREAGFSGAVSTASGAAHAKTDLFQLPRFTPWDRSDWKFGLRIASSRWSSDAQIVDETGTSSTASANVEGRVS